MEAVIEARKMYVGNELVLGKRLVTRGTCKHRPKVKMNDTLPRITNVVR